MQALDGGGNFSEVAATHARRCQQEFETHLNQLVTWLSAHEPSESLHAVHDMMDLWKACGEGQQLHFGAEAGDSRAAATEESGPAAAQADDLDADNDEECNEEADVQAVLIFSQCHQRHMHETPSSGFIIITLECCCFRF